MEKVSNISVKKLLWEKKVLDSRLEFNIKSSNINYAVVNALRRVATTDVPIYAFTDIDINENTSVFNNNFLKLNIENLPVIGITSDKDIFEKEESDEVDEDNSIMPMMIDYIELNTNEDIKMSNLKQLTMYLDYTNDTTNIVTVGTNDCKFNVAEKQIKSPYPVNIPIVKLQPGQKIKLSAITSLGTENNSAIFSPVSIFTYKMNSDNDYDIILESRGQIDELRILDIVSKNLVKQLNYFYTLIPDEDDLVGKMVLQDGEHTLGNLISLGLQSHKNVEFASYNMPHPLDSTIVFHFKLKSGKIKSICKEVVEYYVKLFQEINNIIQKQIN